MFLDRALASRLTRLEMTLSSPIGGQNRVLLRVNNNTSDLDFTDADTQISRDFSEGLDISDIWLGVEPVNGMYYDYIQ